MSRKFSSHHCTYFAFFIAIFTGISVIKIGYDRQVRQSEFADIISKLDGPLMGDNPSLVSYVKKNYLTPPSTLPYNFTKPVDTQNDFAYLIRDHFYNEFTKITFNDKPPGFFIEAGALDGETHTNTLWLEVKKKWTGLLIEPSPPNCDLLVTKQRKAWVSCSCITPNKYAENTVLELPLKKNNPSDSLMLYRSNARSIKSRFHNYNDIIQKTATYTYVTVQCFPLISYLSAINVTTVDVLSLDTQGGEKTTLSNFPFDKVRVNYLFIEYFKRGPKPTEKDLSFIQLMGERNFTLLKFVGGNYIFGNKASLG